MKTSSCRPALVFGLKHLKEQSRTLEIRRQMEFMHSTGFVLKFQLREKQEHRSSRFDNFSEQLHFGTTPTVC